MKYELFKFGGAILRPSEIAVNKYKISKSWDFYIKELTEVIDKEGLKSISKPIFQTAQKIIDIKQFDYLLELILIVKEQDVERKVNWKSTNLIVARSQLFFVFQQTDLAKEIDKKYYTNEGQFLKIATMNNSIICAQEKNQAFEVWLLENKKLLKMPPRSPNSTITE